VTRPPERRRRQNARPLRRLQTTNMPRGFPSVTAEAGTGSPWPTMTEGWARVTAMNATTAIAARATDAVVRFMNSKTSWLERFVVSAERRLMGHLLPRG
jgi:hypothetical protein